MNKRIVRTLGVILLVMAALAAATAVAAVAWSQHRSDGSDYAPPYRITERHGTDLTVEIDKSLHEADLAAILADVRTQVSLDLGDNNAVPPPVRYTLRIVCATGGTDFTDNLLADGEFGFGAADPGVPLQVWPGRRCPA